MSPIEIITKNLLATETELTKVKKEVEQLKEQNKKLKEDLKASKNKPTKKVGTPEVIFGLTATIAFILTLVNYM